MVVRVAVIGCGPSGMSFCHAAESIGRRHGIPIDERISITCFDQSSGPGGIWRAPPKTRYENKINGNETNTCAIDTTVNNNNAYDALYTNGASHCIEYFDYTFDEHFGRPISVYMPRDEIFDYLIGRVTKNCPNFFEKYVEFETQVLRVTYDEDEKRFNLTVKDMKTDQVATRHFEKCVWACGQNSKRIIPADLVDIFREGGFRGRIIHSSDMTNFKSDVEGKRILIIGGSYSAEDLALQAIKVGVEKVYILSRYSTCWVSYTPAWPMDKVELILSQSITGVVEDGNCIQFQEVEWEFPNSYEVCSDEVETELRGIDTVILSTGYSPNMDMLDRSLSYAYPQYRKVAPLEIPKDWKAPTAEITKEILGEDIPLEDTIHLSWSSHPDYYRGGVLIPNPSMMFIQGTTDHPLLDLDVSAWMLAGIVCGTVKLPTEAQMRQRTLDRALHDISMPYRRFYMDGNYSAALTEGWSSESDSRHDELWWQAQRDDVIEQMKALAEDMEEAHYPIKIGTAEKLNQVGETLQQLSDLSSNHRYSLSHEELASNPWKTFRDYDDAEKFCSIYTGTQCTPLPKQWLEIENDVSSVHDENHDTQNMYEPEG